MELSKQVTSLEISKRLKELGVLQNSLFRWTKFSLSKKPKILFDPTGGFLTFSGTLEYKYSAFTVSELGEMLPCWLRSSKSPYADEWRGYKTDNEVWITETTEADVRGKMLIYLFENKLITF